MEFTEINSRGKRGELLEGIDRQNSRLRTAKTTIIKFGLHASFVELESAKREIGNRVGREQTTVMRICDLWMQEETDRSVTSQNVAQHTESVTHYSVTVRTIRRRLQQRGVSTRRPLLGLPLMKNHRRLRRQW
ncbi:HTH_Tnp_Tc3_2 domain-containing protein [Trichonephila clavipes]|nr:HTH_Tnp_Tc3_2 domain-containing protein [Trichonephila clavipes]